MHTHTHTKPRHKAVQTPLKKAPEDSWNSKPHNSFFTATKQVPVEENDDPDVWFLVKTRRNINWKDDFAEPLLWLVVWKGPKWPFETRLSVRLLQKDPVFQQFVILVSFEGLENKYGLELSRGQRVSVGGDL